MEPFAFEFTGALPNPVDGRDFQLGSIQAPSALPGRYMPDEFFKLVALMQSKTGACGGFSLDQLEQYLTFLRNGQPIALSPRFAYMAEKSLDGFPNQAGTTIRAIGKAATKLGICLDSLVTNDVTLPDPQYRDFTQASAPAKADALTRIEPSYFFLDDLSINGVKQAIYQNKAVILELKVGQEWWTAPNGTGSWEYEDILPLRPPAQVVSSHFMLFGAYEPDPSGKTRLWGVNSWSGDWGQNGFGYFLDDYAPFITGGIALVEISPEVKQTLVKPLPPPQNIQPTQQNVTILQKLVNLYTQVVNLIKGRNLGSTEPMTNIYNGWISKTNWTAVITVLVTLANAVVPFMSPQVQAVVTAILGALIVIFHVQGVNKAALASATAGTPVSGQ
jgi:hypothetical protein